MTMDSQSLEEKRSALEALLVRFPSMAVAFSGGVDSTLLLKVAGDVIGRERVVALTVNSALFPTWELEESRALAEKLGIRQKILDIDLLKLPEVVANGPRRCYHCKKGIMALCLKEAHRLGYESLVDGSNSGRSSGLPAWHPIPH
jgi:pyridinium-3,5-biscarboxylic acid mononucleotide sulfurtransferase